jgi:uncharacterized protein YqgQ
MRDKIKDSDYFIRFIQKEHERIEKFEFKLKNGEVKEDRILSVKKKIFEIKFGIINALYSKGEDISLIKIEFEKILDSDIEISNLHHRYVDILHLLSLSILLEMDFIIVKKIIDLINRDNLEDKLIDFIIKYKLLDWNRSNNMFLHNTPYKAFDEIIDASDKTSAENRLKKYLEKEWYKGHGDCGWHDTHKEKEDLYFGYWSFESAAIVKIMGLDDSSFKDNPYYPYDLVHWNEK